MSDEHVLSQEELEALLGGGMGAPNVRLDLHALGEAFRLALESAADALGQLVGVRTRLTVESAALAADGRITDVSEAYAALTFTLTGCVEGACVWLVGEAAARSLAALLAEGDVAERDAVTAILADAMGTVGAAFGEALSALVPGEVAVTSSGAAWLEPQEGSLTVPADEGAVVFEIGTELEGHERTISYLALPAAVAQAYLAEMAASAEGAAAPAPEPEAESMEPVTVKHERAAEEKAPAKQGPSVKPVEFAALTAEAPREAGGNLDLLLDVPLRVTVELGRTELAIRDIIALGKGQVIALDKMAGEPVDVFVNDKLIAKGEVVVMDEHFGVKITNIISRPGRPEELR